MKKLITIMVLLLLVSSLAVTWGRTISASSESSKVAINYLDDPNDPNDPNVPEVAIGGT